MTVHKDIAFRYDKPYWKVSVYSEPKFPTDQYAFPIRNQSNSAEIFDDDYIKFPCASCMSNKTTLIWADECLTNAGGTKDYEIKCTKCGLYSFYEGQEFS